MPERRIVKGTVTKGKGAKGKGIAGRNGAAERKGAAEGKGAAERKGSTEHKAAFVGFGRAVHAARHASQDIETRRKAAHVLFAIGVFSSLVILKTFVTIVLTLAFALVSVIIIHERNSGRRILDPLFALERDVELKGKGALSYLAGVLGCLALAPGAYAGAIILVLGISDGLATIVGMHGETKLPWNPRKTVRGTLAFLASALVVCVFLLPDVHGVALAVVLALAESASREIDDNLLIPLVGIAFAFLAA